VLVLAITFYPDSRRISRKRTTNAHGFEGAGRESSLERAVLLNSLGEKKRPPVKEKGGGITQTNALLGRGGEPRLARALGSKTKKHAKRKSLWDFVGLSRGHLEID